MQQTQPEHHSGGHMLPLNLSHNRFHLGVFSFLILLLCTSPVHGASLIGSTQFQPTYSTSTPTSSQPSSVSPKKFLFESAGTTLVVGTYNSRIDLSPQFYLSDVHTLVPSYPATSSNYSGFIVRLDANGVPIMKKELPLIGGMGISSALDPQGNIIILADIEGAVSIDGKSLSPSHGPNDLIVMKFGAQNLNLLWAKTYSGTDATYDEPQGLAVDTSSNIYVGANLWPAKNLMKINPQGNLVYSIPVATYSTSFKKGKTGAIGSIALQDLSLDQNGNVYVCGWAFGLVKFGNVYSSSSLSHDYFISKFNPSGAIVNYRRFTGGFADQGRGLVRVDSSGRIFGVARLHETFMQSESKGIISAWGPYTDSWVEVQMDSAFHIVSTRALGGSLKLYSQVIDMIPDGLGNLILAGYTDGSIDVGGIQPNGVDGFVEKLDSSGKVINAMLIGGPLNDFALGIAYNQSLDQLWVGGVFKGALNYGSLVSRYDVASDAYILRFTGF